MNTEIKLKVKISDVPTEFRMVVMDYYSLIKSSLFFHEQFAKDMSFDNARMLNNSFNKVIGAQKIIKQLYQVPNFCLPTFVLEKQEQFQSNYDSLR